MRTCLFSVLLLLLWTATSGCNRPFVEPTAPSTELLSPDLSTLLTDTEVEFVVRATSFREVARVELDGRPMTYDPGDDVWRRMHSLKLGEQAIRIEAFDTDGVSGVDSVGAVYLPIRFTDIDAPPFSEPRGGHAATRLRNGDVLITGGARRFDASAQPQAYLLDRNGLGITRLDGRLRTARVGHTGTLLPDGRVLIVGGAGQDGLIHAPGPLESFVETVEIYDPDEDRFTEIPVDAARPIRRTGHTALVFELPTGSGGAGTFVYLYGGSGDIGFNGPRWGLHDGLRTFAFRNDSLVAIGSLFDLPIEPIAGHTQTPLAVDARTGLGRYLYAGTYFPPDVVSLDETETVTFTLDFTLDQNIADRATAPFIVPRTRHAALRMLDGLVGFFGGRQPGLAGALDNAEFYAETTNRMVALPDGVRLARERWGHTATIMQNGRILLVGGFGADGSAQRFSEWVDLAPVPATP